MDVAKYTSTFYIVLLNIEYLTETIHIKLAHLGDSDKTVPPKKAIGLIGDTTGLDAIIDGYDHYVISA